MTIIWTALAIYFWPITLLLAIICIFWPFLLGGGIVATLFDKISGRSAKEKWLESLPPEEKAEIEKREAEEKIKKEKEADVYCRYMLIFGGILMLSVVADQGGEKKLSIFFLWLCAIYLLFLSGKFIYSAFKIEK